MRSAAAAALAAALALAPMGAGATTTAPSTFNVTVTLTSVCSVTTSPANVAFTYTSFQGSPAVSTGGGFTVKCTNNLPYTMSLDSTSGTVLGLNYTVAVPTTTQTGTGADQAFTVTGSIAANQSGTCNLGTCSGSQTRTLTVTY
jgi:spore coat protein U-like protein